MTEQTEQNGQSGIAVADVGLIGCQVLETELTTNIHEHDASTQIDAHGVRHEIVQETTTTVHVKETEIHADRAQQGDLLDAIAMALLQGVEVHFRPREGGMPLRVTAQRYHPVMDGPWRKSQATRFVSPGYCAAKALREATAEVLAAVELPAERQHREAAQAAATLERMADNLVAGGVMSGADGVEAPDHSSRKMQASPMFGYPYFGDNFVPPRRRPAGFA